MANELRFTVLLEPQEDGGFTVLKAILKQAGLSMEAFIALL